MLSSRLVHSIGGKKMAYVYKELPEHWERKDVDALKSAKTYADVRIVAEAIIRRMKLSALVTPAFVGMVCPYTHKKGLELKHAVHDLTSAGHLIFNQSVFEQKLSELAQTVSERNKDMFDIFYDPLLRSGLINTLFILPDSTGELRECIFNPQMFLLKQEVNGFVVDRQA